MYDYFINKYSYNNKDVPKPTTQPPLTTERPRPPLTTQAPIWTNHVRFNGNGYLDIDQKLLDYQEGRILEIKTELSTLEKEGLLLWQGNNDNAVKNYIALGINQGKASVILL